MPLQVLHPGRLSLLASRALPHLKHRVWSEEKTRDGPEDLRLNLGSAAHWLWECGEGCVVLY